MGENPSPLGEAFKVDDPFAPLAEAGGLRKRRSRDPRPKFVGSAKGREGRDVCDVLARGCGLTWRRTV
jgi:hypothetical protein